MATKKKTSSKSPRPLRYKVLIWCGVALAVLFLLVLLAAWLVFSPYREFPAPQLEEPHHLLLRRIATELRNNRTMKEATLRFSPTDVGLLLEVVRHAAQFAPGDREIRPERFMLKYRPDGALTVTAPVDAAGTWCFGGKIYVTGALFFEKQDAEINASIPELRFGRANLPLPGGADGVYPSWKKQLKKNLPQEFMDSVKAVYPERDGTLVIVYRPQVVRKPLKNKLTKLQSRSSGGLAIALEQLIKAL